jgi:hypothetical protein
MKKIFLMRILQDAHCSRVPDIDNALWVNGVPNDRGGNKPAFSPFQARQRRLAIR